MTESIPDLINPLEVDEIFFAAYQSVISDRTTAQLHDDYQIIWIKVPVTGYPNHDQIKLMRELIISELAHRKPIPWRLRLETRLKNQSLTIQEA